MLRVERLTSRGELVVTGLWPWLAVAGFGALHGLNPAAGWGFVAARGVQRGVHARAWRMLAPIALGQGAAIALVAASAPLGLFAERGLLPWIAGAGAVLAAAVHLGGHLPGRVHHVAGQASLALWSLAIGSLHGAGMMLVPALAPLCVPGGPAREITASGSLALALAAVALHLASMLGVTAALAAVARRGWAAVAHRAARPQPRAASAASAASAAVSRGGGSAIR